MDNKKELIGGMIAGAAIGLAVGILLAPEPGKKTRKRIADSSGKVKDDLMSSVNESIELLKTQFNAKIDQLTRGGKEAVDYANKKVNN